MGGAGAAGPLGKRRPSTLRTRTPHPSPAASPRPAGWLRDRAKVAPPWLPDAALALGGWMKGAGRSCNLTRCLAGHLPHFPIRLRSERGSHLPPPALPDPAHTTLHPLPAGDQRPLKVLSCHPQSFPAGRSARDAQHPCAPRFAGPECMQTVALWKPGWTCLIRAPRSARSLTCKKGRVFLS